MEVAAAAAYGVLRASIHDSGASEALWQHEIPLPTTDSVTGAPQQQSAQEQLAALGSALTAMRVASNAALTQLLTHSNPTTTAASTSHAEELGQEDAASSPQRKKAKLGD